MSTSGNIIFLGMVAFAVGAAYAYRKSHPLPPDGYPWDETRWSDIPNKGRLLKKMMHLENLVELRAIRDDRVVFSDTPIFTDKSYILIDPGYFSKLFKDDEQNFIIAHELGHVKHRIVSKITVFMEVASMIIPSIVIPILFPGVSITLYLITSLVLGWLACCTVNCVGSRWVERLADYEAFSICGEEAGISFLSRFSLYKENQIFNFLSCDAKHPSPQARISNLLRWAKEQPQKLQQQI